MNKKNQMKEFQPKFCDFIYEFKDIHVDVILTVLKEYHE